MSIPDPAAFVRANTELLAPPLVPEVRIHLAHEALPLWERTEEELGEMGLPPPYWAFAWAGGQALARHILDHPALVAGRSVLDFASGSGVVAIAAAKAGAARVVANEIDAFALAALAENAAANDVRLECAAADLIGRDDGWEIVLVGDAFYEKPLADRLAPWLDALARRGATVLVGDPGRTYLPKGRLASIAAYSVPVTRALEDSEIKRTEVWRWPAPAPAEAGGARRS
ncbi:class I SAM-dependent methyltransferase [Propylenella binzhouense]|uniref:Methyltransferase n=1 Tax=Propylenella binzhouense TaxID=2555902 RepID=A0A964WUB9_9HYPH|nr:50S ribosomal protein L11 methyltransferase [Propylenella binzhouense]MYZ48952.1 methyltransferase [Propylenella binzhouense]